MEQQTASSVTWINPRLDEERGTALADCLYSLVSMSLGEWGWLIEKYKNRIDVIVSTGKAKPHRTSWSTIIPDNKCLLSNEQIELLSPFHGSIKSFGALKFYPICTGGLVLEGRLEASKRLLASLQLNWELLVAQRETSELRKKVQKLSAKLEDSRQPAQKLNSAIKSEEKKAEALSRWYRQASGMLSSEQLAFKLPKLAAHAQHLLEVDVASIMVVENNRVRLWGTQADLPSTLAIEQLGAMGRKVLSNGKTYSYQRSANQQDHFLTRLKLASILIVPLIVETRVLGALLLGNYSSHRFAIDEIELANLTAYQVALLLENSLLATGVNVERVVAKSVLESMADGVLTLDWEKKITSFNPAAEQITGWSAPNAIGKTYAEVTDARYPTDSNEALFDCNENCPLLTILANQELMEKGLSIQGTIKHKDGTLRYVHSTFSIITNKEDLLGAVVVFRDITEQHERESLRSEYAAALTHDLKTPLTAIKGYAVTLLRKGQALSQTSRKEALEVINFEIDRVSRMLDNLLHQARLEAGITQHAMVVVSPLKVIKQVISLYAYSGKSHQFTYQVQPEDLHFKTDRDQLDQILNNLVSNAVKYSPSGSAIIARCNTDRERPQMIRFEIIDSGPGIAPKDIPLIFKRFHRTSGASFSSARGTGLGLYITKMLVESLGGEIGVFSELGKGSCFWFRLPQE